MCVVKGGEGDDKERSGVFPSIDQVREGPLGVAVPSQALDESKPGRKTLDHRPDPVGVGITNVSTCRETHTRARLTFIPLWLFCRAWPQSRCAANPLLGGGADMQVPTWTANETVVFLPVQLKAVEADHVFQVHENNHQRVQLVCQPKVCKADPMEGSRHHSELEEKAQTQGARSSRNKTQISEKIHVGLCKIGKRNTKWK